MDQPNLDFAKAPVTKATLGRGRRALSLVTSFFLGQGALQAIQVIAGLLVIRWLSVDALAQFGITSSLQATMSTLMDLGIASTVIPLIGERRDDRKLLGQYIRSAKHLRNTTFLTLAPVTVIAFFVMTFHRHWGWRIETALIASVLLYLYSSGSMSCFSPPLLLFRRLGDLYIPQTIVGTVRLIGYLIFEVFGALNAWTASCMNALNIALNGVILEKQSHKYMEWPKHRDLATSREIIHYVLPALPAVIFAAFQGQISLFLISFLGSTSSIAQVTALTRLGQIFSVLVTLNVVLIEPYIARINRSRLLKYYVFFLLAGLAFCFPITLLAFTFPTPFIWILGSQYQNLADRMGWVVLAACVNYMANIAWIMNRARKWIFWSGTILEIALLLIVQIAYILIVGIRTTNDAIFLTLTSSFCYVIAHGYVGIYGFMHAPHKMGGAGPEDDIVNNIGVVG